MLSADVRHHRCISVGTSGLAAALGHCGHRLFRFSMCPSDGQTPANDLSAANWHYSLPSDVINCDTLSVFKSRLKTRLHIGPLPPARYHDALQMYYYYYYLIIIIIITIY